MPNVLQSIPELTFPDFWIDNSYFINKSPLQTTTSWHILHCWQKKKKKYLCKTNTAGTNECGLNNRWAHHSSLLCFNCNHSGVFSVLINQKSLRQSSTTATSTTKLVVRVSNFQVKAFDMERSDQRPTLPWWSASTYTQYICALVMSICRCRAAQIREMSRSHLDRTPTKPKKRPTAWLSQKKTVGLLYIQCVRSYIDSCSSCNHSGGNHNCDNYVMRFAMLHSDQPLLLLYSASLHLK